VDTELYLHRMAYEGSLEPTLETLTLLQRCHLRSVPFENLDIHLGRTLELSQAALFDKIVVRRRGGFCFELNGLFAALLADLGYDVTMLSARTYDSEGILGPPHDHLALLVVCEGRWLVDVGFGDSFEEPLSIDSGESQRCDGKDYFVVAEQDRYAYILVDEQGTRQNQYEFSLEPHVLSDFEAMCRHHQTSPDSIFTKKTVCTRLAEGGRVTLRDRMLIRTTAGDPATAGEKVSTPIADDAAWRDALREHFGVTL